MHDRKGNVLREGCTYYGDGSIVPWQLRHSLRGRTHQFDVLVDGHVWRTCGRRKLPSFLRNISA